MIPTLTPIDIKITWREPDNYWGHRIVTGNLSLSAEAGVSPGLIGPEKGWCDSEAEYIVRRTILRKVYPVDIIHELRALREECLKRCKTSLEAHELADKFQPLIDALKK